MNFKRRILLSSKSSYQYLQTRFDSSLMDKPRSIKQIQLLFTQRSIKFLHTFAKNKESDFTVSSRSCRLGESLRKMEPKTPLLLPPDCCEVLCMQVNARGNSARKSIKILKWLAPSAEQVRSKCGASRGSFLRGMWTTSVIVIASLVATVLCQGNLFLNYAAHGDHVVHSFTESETIWISLNSYACPKSACDAGTCSHLYCGTSNGACVDVPFL